MTTTLSVCIPVYNCAEFVGEALDSILPQLTPDIEIIVLDGGSSDATADILHRYVSTHPHIHYHRNDRRGGIDSDLASCVDLASGEYCWLFSGDDVMRPNAISRLFTWLQSEDDIYVCQHSNTSLRMVELLPAHPVMMPNERLTVDFSQGSRVEWFERACTTEAFFSFMSGLIVRRSAWNRVCLPAPFLGSCWGHVARLFAIAPLGLRATYVPEVWLARRGENDSFADKGVVNRYRIAIEGYHRLASHYFGTQSREAFHIRRVVRNEFGLRQFMYAKSLCRKHPSRESEVLLDALHASAYSDRSLKNLLHALVYRNFPLNLALATRQRLRR